jgi:hypothetical protein
MAPVPWNTTHRLDIYYVVDGLTHVIQLPVDALPAGASYELTCKTIAAQDVGDCVDQFILKAKTLFKTTSAFTGYKLFQHVSGTIFDDVFDDSRNVAGTSSLAYQKAGQITITYRDIARHFARTLLLETVYPPFLHLPYPTTDANLDAFIADFLPAAAGALSMYEFVWSRGDNAYRNVVFVTIGTNRKIRRKRGLA